MRDEESHSSSNATTSVATGGVLFGRGRYKLWALVAILLLAFWSMFTGSVTLNWFTSSSLIIDNNSNSNYPLASLRDDLDVLEVEEREKLVRRLWEVYSHSTTIRLPRFWQEAFEAAYNHLTGEVAGVRNNAFSEIAKMSLLSLNLDPPPAHLSGSSRDESKTIAKDGNSMGNTAGRTRRL